ncbi:MAG TPA: DM13 domain-containing protein [Candidatus Limnocylindrales bacterium]|nr:DM13 domain-containing protein [Candidatus Limnocylindrales bacterium]
MSVIGDLGGAMLALLYDYRYPAMAAGAVAVVLLLVAARRFGWAGLARRHPRAGGVAVVAGAVVLAPLAWYLLSPIWIRTELVEPPVAVANPAPLPSGAPIASPSAPAPSPSARPDRTDAPAPDPTATPQPTPTPWLAAPPRTGSFRGTDDFHFARGRATLVETAPGEWTIRLDDFSVRNGPDLFVYLSPDARDYAGGAIEVARLKATDGSFNVPLPPGTDPTEMRSVLIWCKQFSHLFGWATLEG